MCTPDCGGQKPPQPVREDSLLAEGLAVGALIHGGIRLMGAYQDPIQRAVVLTGAVMGALVYGALDALVGMTVHKKYLLFQIRL